MVTAGLAGVDLPAGHPALPEAREKRRKRSLTEKQRAALRTHGIKPGEVRNPNGVNGFSAVRRFKEAFEAAASDEDLAALARDLLLKAKGGSKLERQLVTERLWPKTDRLEVDASLNVTSETREAVKRRLAKALEKQRREDVGDESAG